MPGEGAVVLLTGAMHNLDRANQLILFYRLHFYFTSTGKMVIIRVLNYIE